MAVGKRREKAEFDEVREWLNDRGIKIGGKCPPNELEETSEKGFRYFEFMFHPDLDEVTVEDAEEAIEEIEDYGDLEPASVHTAHEPHDSFEHFRAASLVSEYFDAPLVVHTQKGQMNGTHIHRDYENHFENMNLDPQRAYEQNPETSRFSILNDILGAPEEKEEYEIHKHDIPEREYLEETDRKNFVFDSAHEAGGNKNPLNGMKFYLENFGDQIPVVHLNNIELYKNSWDGLPFQHPENYENYETKEDSQGEPYTGDLNMKGFIYTLFDKEYEGAAIVEVPPECQEDDQEYFMDCARTYMKWEDEISEIKSEYE